MKDHDEEKDKAKDKSAKPPKRETFEEKMFRLHFMSSFLGSSLNRAFSVGEPDESELSEEEKKTARANKVLRDVLAQRIMLRHLIKREAELEAHSSSEESSSSETATKKDEKVEGGSDDKKPEKRKATDESQSENKKGRTFFSKDKVSEEAKPSSAKTQSEAKEAESKDLTDTSAHTPSI